MRQDVLVWSMMGACMLLYIIIGLAGQRYTKNFAMFATARGTVKPWILGFSAAATLASANLFVGVPGWAYQYGYAVFWWILGNTLTISLGLLLFTRRFFLFYQKRGYEIYTVPHWLGEFYKSRALRFGIAILTLFNIYYIAGQNIGLATIFEQLSNLPYVYGVMLGVVIVVAYSLIGGQYAGIITDFVQWVLMAVTGLLILGSIFILFGSNAFSVIHSSLKAQNAGLTGMLATSGIFSDWFSILAIQWLLFCFILLPHLGNLVLALKEEHEIKPFLTCACLGFFFASSFMWLGGLAARVLYPNLSNPDSAIPVYVLSNFSPVASGIILGGIMAAVLSTTDSLYIGMATVITNDILFVQKHKILLSRLSTVVVAAVSFFISMQRPKSLTLLTQFGISAILSGITVLIGYAHFGKKSIPPWVAFGTFFLGSSTYLILTTSGIVPNIFKALAMATLVTLVFLGSAVLLQRSPK